MPSIARLRGDNGMKKSEDLDALQNALKDPASRERAVRVLVSMAQRGEDAGGVCSDIVKAREEGRYKIKVFCGVFLRYTLVSRPASLLLCTNGLMKDFCDPDWRIQRCAVTDAVRLGDDVILKNYVYDLKRLSMHPQDEVRIAVALAIGRIHGASGRTFYENGFPAVLTGMLSGCGPGREELLAAILEAILGVESTPNAEEYGGIVTIGSLLDMIDKHRYSNVGILRLLLGILHHRNVPAQEADRVDKGMQELVRHTDVCVFYYAASKLLDIHGNRIHPRLMGELIGLSITFTHIREEQLFNLLLFVQELLSVALSTPVLLEAFVRAFNPGPFIILSTDSEFVKKEKCKVLLMARSTIAEGVLRKQLLACRKKVSVLRLCIQSNFLFPELLDHLRTRDTLELFPMLVEEATAGHISDGWKEPLSNLLSSRIHIDEDGRISLNDDECVPADHGIDHLLESAALLGKSIPAWLGRIPAYSCAIPLLRFFLRMREKGVLSREECLGHLGVIKRDAPHVRRVKIVMDRIDRARSEYMDGNATS